MAFTWTSVVVTRVSAVCGATELYGSTAFPMLKSFLDGYNVTVKASCVLGDCKFQLLYLTDRSTMYVLAS